MAGKMRVAGALIVLTLFFGSATPLRPEGVIRLKTIVDDAALKATPEIGAANLLRFPLGTTLDAVEKKGEWFKVLVDREGTQVSGFLHEMLVEVLPEDVSPPSGLESATEIAVLEARIEECKELIRDEKDLEKAIADLNELLAGVFLVNDRKKQKELAVEVYLWMGLAEIGLGREAAGLREFRKMYSVDGAVAREAVRNILTPQVVTLLKQAEQEAMGVSVEYALEVETDPPGAAVTVNSGEAKTSPWTFRSSLPRFAIAVSLEGYKLVRDEVYLRSFSEKKKYILEPLEREIVLDSFPSGAAVFLDGSDTGEKTACTLSRVRVGEHALRLSLGGYLDWEWKGKVEAGEGAILLRAVLIGKNYVQAGIWGDTQARLFQVPVGLARDMAGNFYVIEESGQKLKKLDAEGKLVVDWQVSARGFQDLKTPGGIAIDHEGNIYLTDVKRGQVLKLDRQGKTLTRWEKDQAGNVLFKSPVDIAIDSRNFVYIVDWAAHRILKFSPGGALLKTWGRHGDGPGNFDYPRAAGIGPGDEVFILDKGRVQKFSSEGEFLGAWGSAGSGEGQFRNPLGIWVDGADSVYIADTENHRIIKFDADGGFISSWGTKGQEPGQLGSPWDIVVDEGGTVYVVEKDNERVQIFRVGMK